MPSFEIRTFASRTQLDAALAARLEQSLLGAGPAGLALMLSGGHTPLPAYRQLASRVDTLAGLSRAALHLCYSDDRYVPSDAEASNYHSSQPLLDALRLSEDQVLRVRTELPLEEAALDYERRLRKLLERGVRIGLGLLGLGADGHTASLFRAEDLERARGRLAIAVQRPDGMAGISVTPQFLAHLGQPLFVIAGGGKQAAIDGLERGDPAIVAARAVQGCPRVEVWVEEAAEHNSAA